MILGVGLVDFNSLLARQHSAPSEEQSGGWVGSLTKMKQIAPGFQLDAR